MGFQRAGHDRVTLTLTFQRDRLREITVTRMEEEASLHILQTYLKG